MTPPSHDRQFFPAATTLALAEILAPILIGGWLGVAACRGFGVGPERKFPVRKRGCPYTTGRGSIA